MTGGLVKLGWWSEFKDIWKLEIWAPRGDLDHWMQYMTNYNVKWLEVEQ